MLVQPGTLISAGCPAGKDPIFGLQNLNHYSDPSLSALIFHTGVDLKEILPIKGAQKMEQPDPAYAMQYLPEAFNGLGGYGFPETNRFMMYDADPVPFQVERTIGLVISTPGPFNNDQIFGLSKFSAFNTHWRVSTSTVTGGRITYGRQEVDLGEWPVLASGVIGTDYIIIVRQVSLEVHEFYLNSYKNPIMINPQDEYWVSNRVRLCLGRPFSTRSEAGVIIGPVFDCMSVISPQKIKEIVLFWSARTGIPIL
jgi:hypothetical protein